MSKDFDYIKDKFDNDRIQAPDSLSEDKILDMLPDIEESSEEFTPVRAAKAPSRRSHVKRYLAIAACALLALIGAPQLYGVVMGAPDTSLVGDELYTFDNYGEIKRLVKSLNNEPGIRLFNGLGGSNDMGVLEESSTSDAAPSAGAPKSYGTSATEGADHSETYLQVEDVDEADIVKTDGKYIYYVNESREVVILSADKGKTKKESVIGSSGVENYIHEIFLKGDILVTVGTVYDGDDGYTGIVTYDISDRSDPKVLNEFRQTGSIVSSRMVGNYVYLITNDYVYNGGRIVPKCSIEGSLTDIPVSDISCVPEPDQSSYVILSAVDISSGKEGKSKTKAVFGASNNIYCNDHNLYTAVTEWNRNNNSNDNTTYTRVVRASLDGLKIKFNATARVRGYVNDQFSMNEKDGYFYVATTSDRDGIEVNNLFVLDSSLKQAGELSGFARNESIKAVRYIADKAYVITYEAIDPLFIIDLSDPSRPVIEGEVKIDGFSTLLIPISEDRLLGIGYATGDNGYGGEYSSGLKLATFDISDPSEPKVIDSKEFEEMDSPVQSTHLALTVNSKEGWFAFPYDIYHYDEEEDVDTFEAGVLVFSADNKIKVLDKHKLCKQYLYRSVYIDKYIYALDGDGNTFSFIPEK